MNLLSDVSRFIPWFETGVIVYFGVVNSFYGALLIAAVIEMRSFRQRSGHEPRWRVLGSEVAPDISLLAPAYNEAATIEQSVRSLLTLYYPRLEVIVVNDGSTDDTLAVLTRQFDLEPVTRLYRSAIPTQPVNRVYRSRTQPRLVVVDKENGGKADALNAAVNIAENELVAALDADTLIESDALQRLVRPFLATSGVVAAGGTIRPINSSEVRDGRVVATRVPRNPLAGFQTVEYLRAFLFGRLGWNRMGGNLIISGAFGLFRRDAILEAGGYVTDTVGEDIELVCRLRRRAVEAGRPGSVVFIPDPVAWTEVPETLTTLGRQRDRWHRGLADTLWRHRRMILNPRYGRMGLIAFPYFLFVELLAPIVEALGVIVTVVAFATGALDPAFALLFLAFAYGYGLVLTVLTVALEEFGYHRFSNPRERLILLLWVLLENLGYRQLTVVWRLRGLARYLRGSKDWGAMTRRGFSSPTDDT